MMQIQVKCRLCRLQLLSEESIVNTHGLMVQDAVDFTSCGAKESLTLTQLFLSEDHAPYWLRNIITESSFTQGKITCPKCNGRLGSFDFLKTKRKCPCGKMLLPSIHFIRDRVDVIDLNHKIQITTPPAAEEFSPLNMIRIPGDSVGSDDTQSAMELVSPGCHTDETVSLGCTAKLETLAEPEDHALQVPDNETTELQKEDSVKSKDCSTKHTITTIHARVKQTVADGMKHSSGTFSEYSSESGVPHKAVSTSKRDLRRLRKLEEDEAAEIAAETNMFDILQSVDAEAGAQVSGSSSASVQSNFASEQRSGCDKMDQDLLLEKRALRETVEQQQEREALVLQSDDVPLEYTCAMCLEVLLNPHITLPCNHDFCGSCLRRLALSVPISTKCPLCRETIIKCIPNTELSRVLHKQYPVQLKLRKQQEKKMYPRNSPLPGNNGPASFLFRLRHRHRLLPRRFGPSRRKLIFMLLNIVAVVAISSFGMILCKHVLGFVAIAWDTVLEKLTGEKLWSEFMGLESRILTVSTVFVLYLVSACMVRFLRLFQQIENAE